MTSQIRHATVDDARAVAEIHVATWQVAYRGQVPDSFLDSLAVDDRRIEAWASAVRGSAWPSTGLLVAERDDGDLVGFAHISPTRDPGSGPETGEVTAIYVEPDTWGTGVGRSLLDTARSSLHRAGCTRATLWVLDTNRRARRFYEHLGWRPDGATKVDDRGTFALHEVRYATPLE